MGSDLSGLPEISQNPFPFDDVVVGVVGVAAAAAWAELAEIGGDQTKWLSTTSRDKISSSDFKASHSFMAEQQHESQKRVANAHNSNDNNR